MARDNDLILTGADTARYDHLFAPDTPAAIRLLYGVRYPRALAHYGAGRLLLHGQLVLVLDGANSLDVYRLSRMIRAAGQPPETFLARLLVSRAFTCHQMAELVVGSLGPAIAETGSRFVICLDILNTFYDEDVAMPEVTYLLNQMIGKLTSLARAGTIFIVTASEPLPGVRVRMTLLDQLKAMAQLVCRVMQQPDGPALALEKAGR